MIFLHGKLYVVEEGKNTKYKLHKSSFLFLCFLMIQHMKRIMEKGRKKNPFNLEIIIPN